jgi:TonB-dependent receptor
MITRAHRVIAACLLCTTLTLLPRPARGQSDAGSVTGAVTSAVGGTPLVGATIVLDGTSFSAATDRAGRFLLTGVPAGEYQLLATYLGHKDERAGVTVTAGTALRVDVKLAPATYSENVTVSAEPIGDGQARALNQQKTAPNIMNVVSSDQIGAFPDPNAAEAASRIPGVSIARDQGEGRYILIRGTEARLNSVLIDGERIPAAEGSVRQVQLDAVPADQLQSIEVSKALTPDMDADAIGGAVNLVTKQAVSKPTLLFSAGGGYNALQDSGGQRIVTATAGRRFADGRAGILAGFSSSSLTRGSENFEPTYNAGYLADLQLRDYQIERERNGFNASGDVRLGNTGSLVFKGIFNKFSDYEVNNRIRFRPPNSRTEHVLKNRNQSDTIQSVMGSGQHLLGQKTTIDYRFAWARSEEDQPDRLDTIFRQSKISFSPNVSPTSIDPTNIQPNPSANNPAVATLNAWNTEIFNTWDRDVTGSFNVRRALSTGGARATFLKAGFKVRDKKKVRDFEATSGSPASTVLFPELQDTGFDNSTFLDFFPANYAPFPGILPDKSRAMFNALPASRIVVDHEGDAENYSATEQVAAGYVQFEIHAGDKLFLLPGVRVESTSVDYAGYNVIYDDGGDYLSTAPVSGSSRSTQWLPGFHLKYALTPDTSLRAAFTRTLARPNYYDLVPYQLVFQEDGEIARGNSSLKPTTSNNIDLLMEHYLPSVGLVSGGFFYKNLTDYIYPYRVAEPAFGDTYLVTQPRNGDSASLWGLEVAFQNQFHALPSPLDGLGVMANYTWTDSSATFPDRTGDATLPGQSSHLGNVSVWWEKWGFSSRVSWNFHGKYIDAVGASAAGDVYYDDHTQLDFNVSQRLTKNIRVYADFLNLGNAPLRYYEGTWDRPIQEEYYRWWTMFGVKVNF